MASSSAEISARYSLLIAITVWLTPSVSAAWQQADMILGGDVAAVKAAVSAGITPENAMGMLVGTSVIPNPDKKLFGSLF